MFDKFANFERDHRGDGFRTKNERAQREPEREEVGEAAGERKTNGGEEKKNAGRERVEQNYGKKRKAEEDDRDARRREQRDERGDAR